MKRLHGSITGRLIMYIVTLSIVALSTISAIVYFYAHQIIVDRVKAQFSSVVTLKEQEIDAWEGLLKQAITGMAGDYRIQHEAAALAGASQAQPEYAHAQDDLRRIAGQMAGEFFSTVMFLDKLNGQVIVASSPDWEGKVYEAEPCFREGLTGTYISDMSYNVSLERPVVTASAPVKNSSGVTVGVLLAYASMDPLNNIMLERSGLGETGRTYLVSRDNLLLTGLTAGQDMASQKWIFTEGVRQALSGKSGTGSYTSYDGGKVMGAYQWLDNVKAALLVEMREGEAFAPVEDLGHTIWVVGGIMIALAVCCGMAISRRLTRPVVQLAEYSWQIRDGDYTTVPSIRGGDEVGALASGMQAMVGKLVQAQHELRELSRRLIHVQEQERRSIARELHDQTGQYLTVLKLMVDQALKSPGEGVGAKLKEVQTVLGEMMSQVRNLSLDLRPAMLDDLGLLPALLWYFERYTARTQVKVNFRHSGLEQNFPTDIRTAAYRIVQEALTNVLRHAKVSEVNVTAWADERNLHVQVDDEGAGFEPSHVGTKSSGLSGMKDRAYLAGGTFTVDSAPGAGTCITVELPLGGEVTENMVEKQEFASKG